MQNKAEHCTLLLLCVFLFLPDLGCARRTFRAANLPPDYCAPPPLNLEAINLAGMANTSVSKEVVQPGDVLDVSMITDYAKLSTTTTPVRVADDGSVVVPLVGQVQVGGLEIKQAEQIINHESILRGIYRNPCITVTMKQCRKNKVTVVGAVKKPGQHELDRGNTSLMTALVAAEGLSEEAGTEVEIHHTDLRQVKAVAANSALQAGKTGGQVIPVSYESMPPDAAVPTVTRIDLAAAAAGLVKVPELQDGDVVNVAKRTLPPVHVIGLVRKSGKVDYPINRELRLLDAIAMAGGVSNPVAEEVLVIRQVPNEPEPIRIAVSIQGAKNGRDNILLAPGDTVTVEQTAATMTLDVIQTFVRISFGGSLSTWF